MIEEVGWDQVDLFTDALIVRTRKEKLHFTGVYGIPRGGLILATLISYKSGLPLLLAPIKGCLVVDDIADSGRTLAHFTENDTQFNKYFIATMFYRDRSSVKPDYYFAKNNENWIMFPWEKGQV